MKNFDLKIIFKNVFTTFGRQLLSAMVTLFTLALIARTMGASGNGVYTIALLVPTMLATFLNLGVGTANVYYIGSGKLNPREAWDITIIITIILSIIGYILGFVVIEFASKYVFKDIEKSILFLSLLFFPVSLLTMNISSIFQATEDFKNFNFILIFQPFINLLIIIILILLNVDNIKYFILSYFLTLLATHIISYYILKTKIRNFSSNSKHGYMKKILTYGYKAHLSNILAFVNYRADIVILGYFVGVSAIGTYSVGVSIAEKLWLVSSAVGTVILPLFSKISSGDKNKNILPPLIARLVLWFTFFTSLILIYVNEFVIELIFGSEFYDSSLIIIYLVPGIILAACSRVISNDLAARGRPELNLYTSILTVSINILGNIILIPLYGVVGAATATSFAYIINFISKLIIYNWYTKIPFFDSVLIKKSDLKMFKTSFLKLTEKYK